MALSSSLSRLQVMVAMARVLRGIPNENIVFLQYPVLDADPEKKPGRVIPHPTLAQVLLERLQADEPFTLAAGSLGFGSTNLEGTEDIAPPTAQELEVLEGLVGQTAGDETCTVPR